MRAVGGCLLAWIVAVACAWPSMVRAEVTGKPAYMMGTPVIDAGRPIVGVSVASALPDRLALIVGSQAQGELWLLDAPTETSDMPVDAEPRVLARASLTEAVAVLALEDGEGAWTFHRASGSSNVTLRLWIRDGNRLRERWRLDRVTGFAQRGSRFVALVADGGDQQALVQNTAMLVGDRHGGDVRVIGRTPLKQAFVYAPPILSNDGRRVAMPADHMITVPTASEANGWSIVDVPLDAIATHDVFVDQITDTGDLRVVADRVDWRFRVDATGALLDLDLAERGETMPWLFDDRASRARYAIVDQTVNRLDSHHPTAWTLLRTYRSALANPLLGAMQLESVGIQHVLGAPPPGLDESLWLDMVIDYARWSGKLDVWEGVVRRRPSDATLRVGYARALHRQVDDASFAMRIDRERRARAALEEAAGLGLKLDENDRRFLDSRAFESRTTCDAIAAYASEERLGELLARGRSIAAPDGHRYGAQIVYEGTAAAWAATVLDLTTRRWVALKELPDGDEQAGWYQQADVVVGPSGPYLLAHQGVTHPAFATSLDGRSACTFSTETTQSLRPVLPRDAALCRSLDEGESMIVEFTDVADERRRQWIDSKPVGVAMLDFANAGRAVAVVELEYASGGGAGCDATWFDTPSERPSATGRSLLQWLQWGDGDAHSSPAPCFNAPRFHRFRDVTYFEQDSSGSVKDGGYGEIRFISRIARGKVVEVCRAAYSHRISVKTVVAD